MENQRHGLRLQLEWARITYAHFKPQLDACFDQGRVIDFDGAIHLRPYTFDKEAEVSRLEQEIKELDATIEQLARLEDLER